MGNCPPIEKVSDFVTMAQELPGQPGASPVISATMTDRRVRKAQRGQEGANLGPKPVIPEGANPPSRGPSALRKHVNTGIRQASACRTCQQPGRAAIQVVRSRGKRPHQEIPVVRTSRDPNHNVPPRRQRIVSRKWSLSGSVSMDSDCLVVEVEPVGPPRAHEVGDQPSSHRRPAENGKIWFFIAGPPAPGGKAEAKINAA